MSQYEYDDFVVDVIERRCHERTELAAIAIFPNVLEHIIDEYLTIECHDIRSKFYIIFAYEHISDITLNDITENVVLSQDHSNDIKNITCASCNCTCPHIQLVLRFKSHFPDCAFIFTWTMFQIVSWYITDDISYLDGPLRDWFNVHVWITDNDVVEKYIRKLIETFFGPKWQKLYHYHGALEVLGANEDHIDWSMNNSNAIKLVEANANRID